MTVLRFALLYFAALSLASAEIQQGSAPAFVANARDYGAAGDGVRNDSEAFRRASEAIEKAGGGKLFIPAGVYLVGEQKAEPDGPVYCGQKTIFIDGVANLVIEGEKGTVLRTAPGLRFGAFDLEGNKIDPPLPFTDRKQSANVGAMISVSNSRNVTIRNLELDGNIDGLELGGFWGDTGRQLEAYGLRLHKNTDVRVENIHTHHHALDGIAVGYQGLKPDDGIRTPHYLKNVVSEYNARQGLSWVGGRGLTAEHCKFNHMGRARFASSPAAGLDIEAEESVCRDGLFVDCEFVDNTNCGMVADSGDGGYTRFEKCTFWGTTNWAIWPRKPGLVFKDCVFYGSIVHGYGSEDPALATRFEGCRFEDPLDAQYPVFRAPVLVTIDAGPGTGMGRNITFEGCKIRANRTMAMFLRGSGFIVKDCEITHAFAREEQHSYLSLFDGVAIENTRFLEDFPDGAGGNYFIEAPGPSVEVGSHVVVDGPCVVWGWRRGMTGEIPPTPPSER